MSSSSPLAHPTSTASALPLPASSVWPWLKVLGPALLALIAALHPSSAFRAQMGQNGMASPADQLQELAQHVDAALGALMDGDVAAARHEFEEFDEGWEVIEDGIRAVSRSIYREIEDAMDLVEDALIRADTPDPDEATAALTRLRGVIDVALPSLAPEA